MSLTLNYRQGSFAFSEDFPSMDAAIAKARSVLELDGTYNLVIVQDGKVILSLPEILKQIASASGSPI